MAGFLCLPGLLGQKENAADAVKFCFEYLFPMITHAFTLISRIAIDESTNGRSSRYSRARTIIMSNCELHEHSTMFLMSDT